MASSSSLKLLSCDSWVPQLLGLPASLLRSLTEKYADIQTTEELALRIFRESGALKQLQKDLHMFRAAAVVQALWRGLTVRRHLAARMPREGFILFVKEQGWDRPDETVQLATNATDQEWKPVDCAYCPRRQAFWVEADCREFLKSRSHQGLIEIKYKWIIGGQWVNDATYPVQMDTFEGRDVLNNVIELSTGSTLTALEFSPEFRHLKPSFFASMYSRGARDPTIRREFHQMISKGSGAKSSLPSGRAAEGLTLEQLLGYLPSDLSAEIRKCSQPRQTILRNRLISQLREIDAMLDDGGRIESLSTETQRLACILRQVPQVPQALKLQRFIRRTLSKLQKLRKGIRTKHRATDVLAAEDRVPATKRADQVENWARSARVEADLARLDLEAEEEPAADQDTSGKPPSEDRVCRMKELEQERRVRAAELILRRWRNWRSVRETRELSARKLQKAWRAVKEHRGEKERAVSCLAARIQAFWRGLVTRRRVGEVKKAAALVRSWWKGVQAERAAERRRAATATIQKSVRQWWKGRINEAASMELSPEEKKSRSEGSPQKVGSSLPPGKEDELNSEGGDQNGSAEKGFDVSSFREERKDLEAKISENPEQMLCMISGLPSLSPLKVIGSSGRVGETKDSVKTEGGDIFSFQGPSYVPPREENLRGALLEATEGGRRCLQASRPPSREELEEVGEMEEVEKEENEKEEKDEEDEEKGHRRVALENQITRALSSFPENSDGDWKEEDFCIEMSEGPTLEDNSSRCRRVFGVSSATAIFFKKKGMIRDCFRGARLKSSPLRLGSMKLRSELESSPCSFESFGLDQCGGSSQAPMIRSEGSSESPVLAESEVVSPWPAATIGCELELCEGSQSFASDNSWASDPGMHSWAKIGWDGLPAWAQSVQSLFGLHTRRDPPGLSPRALEVDDDPLCSPQPCPQGRYGLDETEC